MNIKATYTIILLTLISYVLPAQEVKEATSDKGFLHSYWQSLVNGHIDRTLEKKFDVTFAVSPTFTQEGSFGIGGTMTGLYRLDRKDTSLSPSNIILSASASLRGFYVVEASGTNYFADKKGRLLYNARFSRKNLDFWGLSFKACESNPASKYIRTQVKVDADYIYALGYGISIGAGIRMNYAHAASMTSPEYLDGQPASSFMSGVNLSAVYDTRDNHTNPSRGLYLMARCTVWPQFVSGFGRTIFSGGMTLSGYYPLWKGAVLAGDIYIHINEKDCPWNLKEEICGYPGRMRGYYIGRYTDSSQICTQIELRQRLLGRLGAVAWYGAGTLFPSLKDFSWSDVLPAYGFGLRFEYKKDMNLRADLGFGRNAWGFSFGFSEAF